MALNLEQKKAIVSEVNDVANNSVSALIADYRGIKVDKLTHLRSAANKQDVYLRVVRNTLAKIALKDTQFDCLRDKLSGPLMLAFSRTEPGAAAKLFKQFIKENKELEVQNLALSGVLYESNQLDSIASLPSKDDAIAMLLSVMQAPITKMVRTLVAPQEKLVRVLAAVKEKKSEA